MAKKSDVVIADFVKPYTEMLEKFIAAGGTDVEFTMLHPFEAGVIFASTMIAIKLM